MATFFKLPFYLLITAGIGGGSGGGAHFEGFDGNFPKFTFRRAEDIFKYDRLSLFLLYLVPQTYVPLFEKSLQQKCEGHNHRDRLS